MKKVRQQADSGRGTFRSTYAGFTDYSPDRRSSAAREYTDPEATGATGSGVLFALRVDLFLDRLFGLLDYDLTLWLRLFGSWLFGI